MSAPVLVTWATRYGATEEVALVIAAELRRLGLTVDATPMRAVTVLHDYAALVLGFALYMSRIHGDARRFLAAHRDVLGHIPSTLFVLGPIHDEENERVVSAGQLRRQLARFPWYHPVAQQIFGGKWDPATFGFPLKWIPALRMMPVSDARDWDAIRAWAATLPPLLQLAPQAA